MGPEAMSCKETCFPLGRRALATFLMSQMERTAQESPEPGGCLPTAPLQPKWKNIQPHTCLLRPRALAEPPPRLADAEMLTLAFFGQISLGERQRQLRHPWLCGCAQD